MAKQFTEADARKLAELKDRQRQAKIDERNEKRKQERVVKNLFGMTINEVNECIKCRSLIEEFQNIYGEEYSLNRFEKFVNSNKKKQAELKAKQQKNI